MKFSLFNIDACTMSMLPYDCITYGCISTEPESHLNMHLHTD